MPLIDLSHIIATGMPQWPGDDQALRIVRRSEHGPDSHQSSSLELGCHVGTHIDAPLHFLAGEPGLEALPPGRFVGRARVVRCGEGETPGPLPAAVLDGLDLAPLDFVVFDTGWGRHWGTPRYYREWPWYSEELARRLADAGLLGTGLDSPSLDPYGGQAAHDICAPAGMINVENLANLGALPDAVFTLLVLPLRLQGAEASPVRAVALLDDPGQGGAA
jgi:kynurenine formamidase